METIENYNDVSSSVKVLKEIQSGSYAKAYFINKNGKYYYRKLANTTTGGVDKLQAQLEFLLIYGKELKMSKIEEYYYDEKTCFYDMLSNNTHKSFFSFIQNENYEENWSCLQNVLFTIKNFHKNNLLQYSEENLKKYLNDKVFGNADCIINNGGEYIKKLINYNSININGQAYKNFKHYFGSEGIFSYDYLYNLFKEDSCSIIHGDFTIDNMIYDESLPEKVYLIDPNVKNIHETSYLDYAKLLQSLHGIYEYYSSVKNLKIDNNYITFDIGNTQCYEKLYNQYDNYLLANFTEKQYKSIYAHEIVHWLRLMPYKINKNPETATLYYSQLLIILSDFEKKFKGDFCEN